MCAEQLGFDALLHTAATDNQLRKQERACAQLPDTMAEGASFLRSLIDRHHAAMLMGDSETIKHLREEAHQLALKLNNYEPGILADDDAPGCVLDRLIRASEGAVPSGVKAALSSLIAPVCVCGSIWRGYSASLGIRHGSALPPVLLIWMPHS